MPKPLIHTVTGLSGDVSVRCILSVVREGKDYIGNVRKAFLSPLSRDRRTDICPCNLLTSDYSRDIVAFYKSAPDGFYRPSGSSERPALTKNFPESNFNMDYSWGCGRIRYQADGCTHSFFAPLWTDGELPEYFEIIFKAGNLPEKRIRISLTEGSGSHYLPVYLKRYCEGIDDRVMRLSVKDKCSYIFGLSLERGGFSTGMTRGSAPIWEEYMTVNRYDDTLVSCFEKSRYIAKQLLPLSFDFNLEEILGIAERKQRDITVSGHYVYRNERLPLYSFDTDYVEYSPDTAVWDGSGYSIKGAASGRGYPLVHVPGAGVEKFHLYEGSVSNYRFSPHKLVPRYFRWELCGNSDRVPYIINGTEEYNFTGYIGRYYHTPMKTPYFGTLDRNGKIPEASNCEQFYKPFQGIWFEDRNDSLKKRVAVYNDSCLFNGVLYNLEGRGLRTFTVSLEINDVEDAVSGPVSVVQEKFSGAQSEFIFDNTVNSLVFGGDNITVYTEEDLYIINNPEAVSGIGTEGYGTPVPYPVLVSEVKRSGNPPERASISDDTTLETLLKSLAGILFPDPVSQASENVFGPFKSPYSGLENNSGYGYVRDRFLESSSDSVLWDSMALAAASGIVGNKTGYFMLKGGEYEEIRYPTAIDPQFTDIYVKKPGSVTDYNMLIKGKQPSHPCDITVYGSYLPCIPYLHRKGNYLWVVDPGSVDDEMLSAALAMLDGSEPELDNALTSIDIKVWDIDAGLEGKPIPNAGPVNIPTRKEVAAEIYKSWVRPRCILKDREHLKKRLYGPNGIFEELGTNIYEAVLCINSYGFGVSRRSEILYVTGETFPAGNSSVEACSMFDFSRHGFIESAPEAELYLPVENVLRFYKTVMKFMNTSEQESALNELETSISENSVKKYAPVRYRHDLVRADGKLYLAEYLYDKPYKFAVGLDLVREDSAWKITYGEHEFIINETVLDGKTDLIVGDDNFYLHVIKPVFLGSRYEPEDDKCIKGHSRRDIQLMMNEPRYRTQSPVSPTFRLWYQEEYISAAYLPAFKEALQMDTATARFFRRQFRNDDPARVSSPVIEGFGDKDRFLEPEDLQDSENLMFVSDAEFMIPAENVEMDKIPLVSLIGRKEPYILRKIEQPEYDYLKNIGISAYPLCTVPTASSKISSDKDGNGELKVDLYVKRDRSSFLIAPEEAGLVYDYSKGLDKLLEEKSVLEILPYINFPTLSYLYSLPFVVVPEKTTLVCGLSAVKDLDGNIELYRNDAGKIDIYRYYGWCRPSLVPAVRRRPIYGQYSAEFDFLGEYKDRGIFRYESDIENNPRNELSLASEFSSRGESLVVERETTEQKWFNDSRIIYLPPSLEYTYSRVRESEVQLWENSVFEIFKKLCVTDGLASYDDEEYRFRYLFFNYRAEFHKKPVETVGGERLYELKFIFVLK